jgi:hypothetical protein
MDKEKDVLVQFRKHYSTRCCNGVIIGSYDDEGKKCNRCFICGKIIKDFEEVQKVALPSIYQQ